MYAVIFKAVVKKVDEEYISTAAKLRDLAINEYGCAEFISCMEGKEEIAISYWRSKEDILAWKNNLEHKNAQQLGKKNWYSSYEVQIVEVLHSYGSSTSI